MASASEEPKQAEKKNTFPRLQLRAKTSAPAPSDAADTPDTADAAPADGPGAGDGLGDDGQAKHDWHASTKPAEPAKASGSDAWPPPPPRPSARVPAKARPTSRPARAGQLGQLPIPPMPVPMMPMPMPMPGMPGPAVPYMPMRGFLTVPHAPYMGCRPHMEPTEARCRPVVGTLRPVTVWVDDSGFVHAPPPRPPPLPAELPVEQPQSPPKQPEHPTPVDSFRAAFTPPNVAKGKLQPRPPATPPPAQLQKQTPPMPPPPPQPPVSQKSTATDLPTTLPPVRHPPKVVPPPRRTASRLSC